MKMEAPKFRHVDIFLLHHVVFYNTAMSFYLWYEQIMSPQYTGYKQQVCTHVEKVK